MSSNLLLDENTMQTPEKPTPIPSATNIIKNNQYLKLDFKEIMVRLAKYAVEAIAVGFIAAVLLHDRKIKVAEIVTIALTAASMFSILDLFSPSISVSARNGAGFALGSGLVGGIKVV